MNQCVIALFFTTNPGPATKLATKGRLQRLTLNAFQNLQRLVPGSSLPQALHCRREFSGAAHFCAAFNGRRA
jgi:hypothetical protein